MPPSVANYLPSPATLTKNVNLSLKSTSPTSSDPSAFPTALERAGRFEAQKPRDVRPANDRDDSKVTKKPAKQQTVNKKDKPSDDVGETAGPKSKRTKTATVDAEKPADDATPVDEKSDAADEESNIKEVKADPSDAEAALAQVAAQQAQATPVDHSDTDLQSSATDEKKSDSEPVAALAADKAVSKTEGDADADHDPHGHADEGSTDDAIAKALADHVDGQKAPKEAAAKAAPAHSDVDSAPELGSTSTGDAHSRPHPTHPAEKLDEAMSAFSAMSAASGAAVSAPADDVSNHASSGDDSDAATFDAMLASARSTQSDGTSQKLDPTPAPAATPRAPEARFALENHEKIVSSVKTELLPGGGSMKIKLDPPELGPMAVSVHMREGVMTATFETSSDEAAKLLSHSLGQLKSSLESQGISVEKLHVQQTSKSSESNGSGSEDSQQNRDGQSPQQEASSRQEQQRKDMLRRMWRKLSGFEDPLDVTG